MNKKIQIQLAIMMFLQFVVWGAWYGQLSKYLFAINFTGQQVGNIYATFSIAMLVAPFFIGMLADRFFHAQKVLGVLNIIGAVILFAITQTTEYPPFYILMLAYCLSFAPTIALTSSISMTHMTDPEKQFPLIRLFGTIAWIAITNLVGILGWGDKVNLFYLSIAAALAMGIYSFTLPKTPPTITGPVSWGSIVGKDSFVLFKDRSFLIFFIASILICIPLAFYYSLGNPSITDSYKAAFLAANPGQVLPETFYVENKMSLGQVSEVLFMLLLPLAYKRFGIKNIMLIAIVAWLLRFVCFGYGDAGSSAWMLYIGILLHGICFDFFFVSGMIYTDQKAGSKIKSQAQGLISLATYGVGMFIGSYLSGIFKDKYTTGVGAEAMTDWTKLWMVPAMIAAVVLILFLLFFKDKKATVSTK